MKKTFTSGRAALAVVALCAVIGLASISVTEAVPVINGIGIQNEAAGIGAGVQDYPAQRQQEAVLVEDSHVLRLRKRQANQTPSHAPERSTSRAAQQTRTQAPDPTRQTSSRPPARQTETSAPRASSTTSARGASSGEIEPTGTGSGTPPPVGTGAAGSGEGVPTGVSTKVLIGLGTVGGFFVFALGGLAFCRHRKKKNLASALLQQTAQFNNNNPYAKLPEPVASPKESLPMTPTKPMGTYNVVATYTPALADEIEIALGDSVTILQEYDDGWCMGVNNTRGGAKGVFPRHCVEMGPYEGSQHGAPGGPHFPPSPSFKAATNKRISSIPAGGWNDGPGYFPPQPSPQHLGPNQGPPYQGGGGGGGYYNGNGGY
ncbi:hypothetical protein BGZ75_007746 [Mortierella antarctica]|nr:hypothetical protein BGZ67_001035 [Mortierella alpina]KAF9989064.1 hypothetical protein BGZ75_007746 [Mortierella antarctica]